MNTIKYDGKEYLELQTKGFAAQYAFPFAKQILTGKGLDIGPNREDWAFPGARMIDLVIPDEFDAFNLPNEPSEDTLVTPEVKCVVIISLL